MVILIISGILPVALVSLSISDETNVVSKNNPGDAAINKAARYKIVANTYEISIWNKYTIKTSRDVFLLGFIRPFFVTVLFVCMIDLFFFKRMWIWPISISEFHYPKGWQKLCMSSPDVCQYHWRFIDLSFKMYSLEPDNNPLIHFYGIAWVL